MKKCEIWGIEMAKGENEDVRKTIQEARDRIDLGRYKAHVLRELFNLLTDNENCNKGIEDMTLFSYGIEAILGEIVAHMDEARETLTHLSLKSLKRGV